MIKIFLYLSIFLTYTLSIYVYAHNILDARISAALWVSSLLLSLFLLYPYTKRVFAFSGLKKFSFYKFVKENYILIAIIILAILLRFWGLDSIPILTHDEGKDTGLFPQMVLNGELKDYFGLIQGMNNLFFVFSSIPHILTNNPMLKARLFSALFGVFSVILIFILVKKLYGKKTGLIAALFLSAYHIHIHFSRTEFLNLFDGFYALIILIAFYILSRSWKITNIILLSVVLGFGLHFYSGLRAIILLTAITFLVFSFVKFNFKKFIIFFITFFFFFLISLGPTIIVMATRSEEFKAVGSAIFVFSTNHDLNSAIKQIAINYKDSILAYIKNPIDFHYNYGGPFLVAPFSIFFLLGFILTFRKIKEPVHFLIIFSLLGIPFLNSAIFNEINYTHRLLSLVPLIILTTSLGIEKIARLLKNFTNGRIELLFIVTICIYFAIYNIHLYFHRNTWEKALNINEFRAWEAQKLINQSADKNTSILFIGNNYMPSYKSVPPLEYLTEKFPIIDIMNNRQLYDSINFNNTKDYILIILPDNNALINDREIIDYFTSISSSSRKIYYKGMYLFDFVRIKI